MHKKTSYNQIYDTRENIMKIWVKYMILNKLREN